MHYQETVENIERVVSTKLPLASTILVVGKGDDELLKLDNRTGWHFPQNSDGTYTGYHPLDSQSAISHLEELKARGAQYLLIPNSSFWWLDYYVGLHQHLDDHYQCIWSDDYCVIYELTPPQDKASSLSLLNKETSPANSGLQQAAQGQAGGTGKPSTTTAQPAVPRIAPPPAGHLRFVLDYPETLPLAPPAIRFDPHRMNLHWVMPDFSPGMGGPMAIFRFIKFLEAFGHRNTIWIRGGTGHGTAETARQVIRDSFVEVEAQVHFLRGNTNEVSGDAVIATHCWTAYPVRAVTNVRERFYFIQDYEPLFYPMGSEYLLAEATYRFGFSCITSSKWLQSMLRERYDTGAERFVYAYNPDVYHESPEIQRSSDRIAFYSRTKTARRAVELGLLALEIVAKKRPSLVVDFFGGSVGNINVPYQYVDHGVLNDLQLARLYREATLGVVFSTTNYSLIPHEMMGCGLPVIDLKTESAATDFPHDAITLSQPTPQDIADAIDRMLSNKALREQQATRATSYVEQLSWEKSARDIEAALVKGISARTSQATVIGSDRQPSKTNANAPHSLSISGPIVFVGQVEYYRSVYYDLTSTGEHFEYPYTSFDRDVLRDLPKFVRANGAKTCIIFRPEWFAPYHEAFQALKSQGVAVIGYSTEPVPQSESRAHPDQLERLKVLKKALELDYDLVIHFDEASLDFLAGQGFKRLVAHPLPVSRKLFFPGELPQDFDVCFLGKSTPYREKMLAPLKMRFNTIHVAHGLRDEEACTLMNRSKLVLNIHNEAYPNFENRVAQALFCGRPVFSEIMSGELLRPGHDYIPFDSPDDLCRKVTDFLKENRPHRYTSDLSIFTVEALLKRLGVDA